jgi:hypothetical protein
MRFGIVKIVEVDFADPYNLWIAMFIERWPVKFFYKTKLLGEAWPVAQPGASNGPTDFDKNGASVLRFYDSGEPCGLPSCNDN